MTTLLQPRAAYICRSCLKRFWSERKAFSRNPGDRRHASLSAQASTGRPFRVGIVGSGPAGFYAATRIIERNEDAVVDMYEQLPAPFGLVRYGVAPDHPEVKNCQDRFDQIAQSPRFNFVGNVSVGQDVNLRDMVPHYDALLFAYGASHDRTLGIPGEELEGILSARAFVGWYNGLPEYHDLQPNLQADDTAHVIGNGNVALDVARVLLAPLDTLRKTDMSERAVDTISRSTIKRVQIYGRRGPMQAAFTIKEVRELVNLSAVAFEPMDQDLLPHSDWVSRLPRLEQRKYRLASLLSVGTKSLPEDTEKSWSLQSLLSPVEFQSRSGSSHVDTMVMDKNIYDDRERRFEPAARVHSKGSSLVKVPARLVFRSIGYKSTALRGLTHDLGVPFDSKSGTIPNDLHGRVVSPTEGPPLTARHVDGCYCAGWVKNGPTGVIANTMDDAFASADIMLKDWKDDVIFLNGSTSSVRQGSGQGLQGVLGTAELVKQSLRPVSWQDWLKINAAEQERGRKAGKPREKFKSAADMLAVLD